MKKLLLALSLIALYSTINAQWISQETDFTVANRGLSEIHIIDANTVWALAYDGAPLTNTHTTADNIQEFTRTLDGGATWNKGNIDVGNTAWQINNISPVSATTAWVSAINNITGDPNNGVGYIYKTTNGGTNWTQQLATGFQIAGSSFLNGVYFFDANNGVAYGNPIGSGANRKFEIYKTSDGGTNWNAVMPNGSATTPLSGEYGYNSVPTAFGNSLWFPTNKGRLYRTTDKGVTWTVSQAPLSDFGAALPANSGNVHFSDVNNGYLLKTSGTVVTPVYTYYTTTNGGSTWSAGSPFTGTRRILNYIPATTTIVATSQAVPYGTSISTNNGVTWTDLEPSGTIQRGVGAFLNGTIGWCAGFSDGNPAGGVGIFKLTSTLTNQSFTITKFKVYPNPVKSIITITTTDVDTYTLSITDLTGKILLSESLNGIENTLDVSTFSSGTYFIQLNSDNRKEVVKIFKN